jgi:tetratricopeptide (TPR) repeat protein
VDFYSLGIILYQIIYNHFPFHAERELDIYKSAIESSFDFPDSEIFSKEIVEILKKLLQKDVKARYSSALAIIKDLGFEIDLALSKEFLPAKIYSGRTDAIKTFSQFFADNSGSEVYSIKGFEGAGKSSLLEKIFENKPDAVLISDVRGKSAEELIRYILRQIIFSRTVYPILNAEVKSFVLKFLLENKKKETDELRQLVAALASNSKFILLIDDFNSYDQLAGDFLLDIIPLLQVNNIKVVINESQTNELQSARLNNVKYIDLGPFTNDEMLQFLEESYSQEIPIGKLRELILTNADLIPGNIKAFIKDLILFGIMKFSDTGVIFSEDENRISTLTEAHFSIYDLRLANLSERELVTIKILSALDIVIDLQVLSQLLGISRDESERIASNLQLNNIIQKFSSGQTLIFTSEAIKKYIYASIGNKRELHFHLAKRLSEKVPSHYRVEEARQYELAGEYQKCFSLMVDEIDAAEKKSAFSYVHKLLLHLIQLPLEEKIISSFKVKLSDIQFKLGDVQASLSTIKELKNSGQEKKLDKKLFIIEASALIASGEYESGKKIIYKLLDEITDEKERYSLKVELAYADFELKLYDIAREQCNLLLSEKSLSPELKGRCYNLKGMIDIYQNNDLNSALENFQYAREKFSEIGQAVRVSGTEVNLGNIYNIMNNYEQAELHFQTASRINQSIGNLEQEGLLLQNMGIFYFNRRKFDFAIQSYHKAIRIFLSIGKDSSRGLVLWDLGEIYISVCEYEKALNSLNEAYYLFEQLKDYDELLDVLFMKGKLFYKIGDYKKLEEIDREFQKIYSMYDLRKTHLIFQKLLTQWNSFGKEKIISFDELKLIRNEMAMRGDNHNYLEVTILLIQLYINSKLYREAIEVLYEPELMELCSQYFILEAEREYFLGIISKNFTSEKLLPPMVYFEKAYEIIKDENITELTWKVLSEISELYIDRGNLNKSKHFITYARELIYFIAERMQSPRLRAAYLRQEDRLNTLKKLESFYPQK